MSLLTELCDRALQQSGPVAAVIHGDPGTGKSRLLAEFRTRAAIADRFSVSGFEPEQNIPLASARGLLLALTDTPEQGPLLETLLFGSAPSDDVPEEALRIFEIAHRAIGSLTPALVTVDDLQWVDETSRAMIHFLIRAASLAGQPFVLVAMSRPSADTRSFARHLETLLPKEQLLLMELEPLDRRSGVRLVLDVRPGLKEEEAERIWASGFPFWLELLASSPDGETNVPQLVKERLQGAGSDAIELFALSALAGRPLLLDEAAEAQEWSTSRAGAAARELVDLGLLLEESGYLRMSHDLIGEAAREQLGSERRRRTHTRLAAVLEARAEDDPTALLQALYHRRASGLPVQSVAFQAASSPRRRLLGPDGLRQLVEVADETDPGTPDGLFLVEAVAALAAELGVHSVALSRWSLVADLHPDLEGRARAALEASRAAVELERHEEARALLERARGLARSSVLSIEIDAHEYSVLRMLEHDLSEGRDLGQRALARARDLAAEAEGPEGMAVDTRRAYLRAVAAVVEAARVENDIQRMLDHSEELIEVARGFDYPGYLRGLRAAGFGLKQLARVVEAEERLRAAWEGALSYVLPSLALEVGWFYIVVLRDRGKLDEVRTVAKECFELAERVGDPPGVMKWIKAEWLAAELSKDGWRETADRMREHIEADSDPHRRLDMQHRLALGLARLGGHEMDAEVVERLRAARRDAVAAGCERCREELLLRGADALARAGNVDEARRWLEETREGHGGVKQLWRERALASISVAEGNTSEATRVLETLIARTDGRFELDALWARLDLGRLLASTDRSRAAALLREAAEKAAMLGAENEQLRAEQLLRGLQVRTWRRGRPSATGDAFAELTEREREIAQFVASGASNPEIAQRLFLSRKTVERHVSNILAKLGVKNRVELAARLKMGA